MSGTSSHSPPSLASGRPPIVRGVVVPFVTLFGADGSLDLDATGRLLDRLIGSGIDALFALGTTGEVHHLTVEERREVIRWSAGYVRRRVPLLVGVGDTSTRTACDLARAAGDAGVDGVVATAPYFWPGETRHLLAYFQAIGESSDRPLLLYNYPRCVGVDLSVEFVEMLADRCPTLAGIKETLDSGTHMRRMIGRIKAARPEFSVLCGHDDLALFALAAGADGMVSSTANFAPERFVALLAAHGRGDMQRCMAESSRIGRLVEAYRLDPCGAAIVKAALHARGWIDRPEPRPPALRLAGEDVARLRRILHEADSPGGTE